MRLEAIRPKAYTAPMKRSLVLGLISVLFLGGCFGVNRAPVSVHGATPGAGSSGSHVVMPEDTLWSISKRYKIAMPDIVYANQLSAPFLLEVGQRLRLPPPPEYRVRQGDTLFEIARLFNTNQSQIARLNNMHAPYMLRVGQVLRLPSNRPAPERRFAKAEPSPQRETVAKPAQKPVSQPQALSKAEERKVAKAKEKFRVTKAPPKRSSSKFMYPVEGRKISGFGPKGNGLHNDGINIAAPRGAPVRAAENGVVVYAGNELKGSGNLILVRHEGRYMTAYAHMDRMMIKRGDIVKRGQTIGTVGSTGSVSSPQLHFEVRKGTRAMDPKKYLSGADS